MRVRANDSGLGLTDFFGLNRIKEKDKTQLRNREGSRDRSVNHWVHWGTTEQPFQSPVVDLLPFALFTQGINFAGAVGTTNLAKH